MEDAIQTTIQSPSWWLSVVFAAFFVNLFAAYGKDIVDSVFSRYSNRRRLKAARESQALRMKSEEVLSLPQKMVELKIDRISTLLIIILTLLAVLLSERLIDIVNFLTISALGQNYISPQFALPFVYFAASVFALVQTNRLLYIQKVLKLARIRAQSESEVPSPEKPVEATRDR